MPIRQTEGVIAFTVMKSLVLTICLIALIIAAGFYADAQTGSEDIASPGDTRTLADTNEPADKNGAPTPGSLEWLKIHYPDAYEKALQEQKRQAEETQAKAVAAKAEANERIKKVPPNMRSFKRAEYQPALVLIKGDNGSGTGFICKIRGIPFLVTNIHVLGCADAASSYGDGMGELEAHTLDGRRLTLGAIYGAEGHDLCIIRFAEEADYAGVALEFESNAGNNVQVGDPIVIPGNSKGGGTMLWTEGRVVGLGPAKIEHDAPVYEGNSGSPIIHIDSGKIIGVLSYAEMVPIESFFDKESYNDKRSAIKNEIRYFGYRLDSAQNWYGIDLPRFCRQNDRLQSFSLQRKNVAIFLYTDDSDWKSDQDLQIILDEANEQVRRKAVMGQIGRDTLRQISVTVSLKLNGLIKNDTYREYTRYLRAHKAGGTTIQSYYPYFTEMIEREVQIRDHLSRNIEDWEKRLRQ